MSYLNVILIYTGKKILGSLIGEETIKGFCKKGISQLCVIEELDLLISISDSNVRLTTLSSFKEVEHVADKKGNRIAYCTQFAIKKFQGIFYLATLSSRKLYIHEFNERGSRFQNVRKSFFFLTLKFISILYV